jgi:hypothetical protein
VEALEARLNSLGITSGLAEKAEGLKNSEEVESKAESDGRKSKVKESNDKESGVKDSDLKQSDVKGLDAKKYDAKEFDVGSEHTLGD